MQFDLDSSSMRVLDKAIKALESEVIPVDDKPLQQTTVLEDPAITAVNKQIQQIQKRATKEFEEAHTRAKAQAQFILEQAKLVASKARTEALHRESEKFIKIIEEFYAIVIIDILKEVISRKPFLQINSLFESALQEVRIQLTVAAHCWFGLLKI